MDKKIYSILIGVLTVSMLYLAINSKKNNSKHEELIKTFEQKNKQKNDSLQLYI